MSPRHRAGTPHGLRTTRTRSKHHPIAALGVAVVLAMAPSAAFADTIVVDPGGLPVSGSPQADTITGSADDDFIDGRGGSDEINGQAGDDVLSGGGGNDEINGGSGDDIAFGNGGEDELNGQAGNDVLNGGGGDDTITGGRGNDDLIGENGFDSLSGGNGNDNLNGGNGNDLLEGGAGNDQIDGGADDDFALGGAGDDDIDGDEGDDTLFGQGGNDTIDGSEGNDFLLGGRGNDLLCGGPGDNELFGGDGEGNNQGDDLACTVDDSFTGTQGQGGSVNLATNDEKLEDENLETSPIVFALLGAIPASLIDAMLDSETGVFSYTAACEAGDFDLQYSASRGGLTSIAAFNLIINASTVESPACADPVDPPVDPTDPVDPVDPVDPPVDNDNDVDPVGNDVDDNDLADNGLVAQPVAAGTNGNAVLPNAGASDELGSLVPAGLAAMVVGGVLVAAGRHRKSLV